MKRLKELADKIAAEHGLEWYQPLNKAEDSAGMTAIHLGNGYSLHHEHSENGHDIWAVGFNGERAGTFMLRTEDTRRGKPMMAWAGLEKPHRGKGIGTLAYKALAVHYGGLDSDKSSTSDEAVKAWVRAGGRQMKIKSQFGKPRYTLDGDKKRPVVQWNEDLVKNDSLGTLIQQAKARLEGVKKVGSQEPRPIIFANKNGTKHGFVTVDPSKKGQWRVTHFVNNKPAGHTEAPTFSHAIKTAHESGYNVFKEIPEEELFRKSEKDDDQQLNDYIKEQDIWWENFEKVKSQEPRPMIFAGKESGNNKRHGLITVDPSKKGQWRVTHLVNGEPFGHTEVPTFKRAIEEASAHGYDILNEIPEEEMFKAESLQKDKKLSNQFAGGTYEKVLHEGDGFKVVSNYRHNNVYHGSPNPISKFSASKGVGQLGAGLYLAHDENTGRFHAQGQRQGAAGQRPKGEGHVYQGSFHAPVAVLITDDDKFGIHALDDDNVAEAHNDYGDHLHPRVTKHWGNFVDENYGANAIVFNPSEKSVLTPFTQTLAMKGSKIKMSLLSKAESLTKAAHPSDLKKIVNKTNHDAKEIVDAAPHAVHTPDQEYVNFLNHPKAQKGLGSKDIGGISAKMVHKVGDDTYMAKPYHKKVESATRAINPHPISGWASIATKNLYNAANIGHLCEDVSFHEHNGIPMTVHKFAKNAHEVGDPGYQYTFQNRIKNPNIEAQGKKIAIMDFLTNNLDRHTSNIMFHPNEKKTDHNLLAIDHERSFQYNKGKGILEPRYAVNETPRSYFNHSLGLKPFSISDETDLPEHQTTKAWWRANKDNISNSFNKDIESIKDPHLKNHIKTNFTKRWEWLNEHSSPDYFDFFNTANIPVEMSKERHPKTDYKAIMKNLPENPYKALSVIDGLFTKKLSFATKETLVDLWNEQVDKMSGEEVGNYLKDIQKTKNHPHPKGAYWSLMNRLAQENHRQGMQHLVQNNMIDLPYWKDKFEAVLKLGAMKKQ